MDLATRIIREGKSPMPRYPRLMKAMLPMRKSLLRQSQERQSVHDASRSHEALALPVRRHGNHGRLSMLSKRDRRLPSLKLPPPGATLLMSRAPAIRLARSGEAVAPEGAAGVDPAEDVRQGGAIRLRRHPIRSKA